MSVFEKCKVCRILDTFSIIEHISVQKLAFPGSGLLSWIDLKNSHSFLCDDTFWKGKSEYAHWFCVYVSQVFEETGFDIKDYICKEEYIELRINDQLARLYIIPGVPKNTKFNPKTRREIRVCVVLFESVGTLLWSLIFFKANGL